MSGRTRFLPRASGWGRFTWWGMPGWAGQGSSQILSWVCSVGRWTPGLQVEEKEGGGEGGATDTGVGAAWPLAEPERGEHGRRLGQEGAGFTLIGPGFPSWSSAGPLEAGRMWASEGTREGLACVALEGAAQSHRHPEMASWARTAWIDRAQGPGPKTGPTISAGDAPQVRPSLRDGNPNTCPLTAAEHWEEWACWKALGWAWTRYQAAEP